VNTFKRGVHRVKRIETDQSGIPVFQPPVGGDRSDFAKLANRINTDFGEPDNGLRPEIGEVTDGVGLAHSIGQGMADWRERQPAIHLEIVD